jgi:hypothetical protein
VIVASSLSDLPCSSCVSPSVTEAMILCLLSHPGIVLFFSEGVTSFSHESLTSHRSNKYEGIVLICNLSETEVLEEKSVSGTTS